MTKKKLTEILILHSKGSLPWYDVAGALNEAVEEGIEIDGRYITKRTMREFLRAYRFVDGKNLHSHPRILETSARAVSHLINIEKLLNNPKEFKRIQDGVFSGKINPTDLEKMSLHLKGTEGNYPYKPLRSRIQKLTEDLSDEGKIKEYRLYLSSDCLKLVQRLQCIIDEEYYELWKERKEFEL